MKSYRKIQTIESVEYYFHLNLIIVSWNELGAITHINDSTIVHKLHKFKIGLSNRTPFILPRHFWNNK